MESTDPREKQNFILVAPDIGIIGQGATASLNLESIKTEFGLNFNTITVINRSSEEITLILDGREVQRIEGNNGAFGLDRDDRVLFDSVRIKNEDAVGSTSAEEIRISVGRTGMLNGRIN